VIPKVGFGKLLRDFTEFTIITLGWIAVVSSILFISFWYYFQKVRSKESLFIMFTYFFILILIVISAAKTITIMKKTDYVLPKNRDKK
jgi:hypothetical protein